MIITIWNFVFSSFPPRSLPGRNSLSGDPFFFPFANNMSDGVIEIQFEGQGMNLGTQLSFRVIIPFIVIIPEAHKCDIFFLK